MHLSPAHFVLLKKFGIPSLIVGLTIVSIGTSAPEIVVSTTAALTENTVLALGNVVGSNIFNIALCLGLSGVSAPSGLIAPEQLIALDLKVMVLGLVLLPVAFAGYVVSRVEGGILLGWNFLNLLLTVLAAITSPLFSIIFKLTLFALLSLTFIYAFYKDSAALMESAKSTPIFCVLVVRLIHAPASVLPCCINSAGFSAVFACTLAQIEAK